METSPVHLGPPHYPGAFALMRAFPFVPQRGRFAAAVLLAATVTACGETTTIVKTVTSESEPPAQQEPVSQPSDTQAGVGDLITLGASDSTLKIRLKGVIDPLPVGDYDSARAGHRFVGVEFAVKNMGPEPYSDALSNGSAIILRGGSQSDPTLVSGGPCGNDFGVDVKIAADDTRVGCIAFEVPDRKHLRSFQFTPQSGFGDETGQWELPRGSLQRTSSATSSPASSSSTSSEPSTPAAPAPAPPSTQWTSCDSNIDAKTPGTTCEFASNLFYEYWIGGQRAAVTAYSPAGGTFLSATCISGGESVTCTSPDGSAARFSQAAVSAYSQSQADQYAASHDVGF